MRAVLPAIDAAIVVCDGDEKKTAALQIIMRELEALGIPRLLFLNKIEIDDRRISDIVAMLQPVSMCRCFSASSPCMRTVRPWATSTSRLERAYRTKIMLLRVRSRFPRTMSRRRSGLAIPA